MSFLRLSGRNLFHLSFFSYQELQIFGAERVSKAEFNASFQSSAKKSCKSLLFIGYCGNIAAEQILIHAEVDKRW